MALLSGPLAYGNWHAMTHHAWLLTPERLWSWADLVAAKLPPARPGCYAWFFDRLPAIVPVADCQRVGEHVLAYVGIAPHQRREGLKPSKATLRSRLRSHFRGNAEASTLRLTLGVLLFEELGIELRRVGASGRLTFGAGEQLLSRWMDEHARVAFVEHAEPWTVEHELLQTISLPLNLAGNERHPFHAALTELRARARAGASSRSACQS